MDDGELPKNVKAIIREMNAPSYDFDTAVRHLRREELRLLKDELTRRVRKHLQGPAVGGGAQGRSTI